MMGSLTEMNDGISMNLLFRVQTLCSDEPKCDWTSRYNFVIDRKIRGYSHEVLC